MDRMISYLLALSVAAALMFAWDRHPPIGFTVPIPLWRPRIQLPDSLATQRDNALALAEQARASLDVCHSGQATLQAGLDRQNQAVGRMQAQGQVWAERGRQALQGARAVAESYRVQARAIEALPRPRGDACAAADALILQEAAR